MALSLGCAVCEAEHVTCGHKYTVLTQDSACRRRVYIYITKYRAVVSCEVTGTSLFTCLERTPVLLQETVALRMREKKD